MTARVLILGLLCAATLCVTAWGQDEGGAPVRPRREGPNSEQRFTQMDTDGNGAISLEEYSASRTRQLEQMKKRMGDRFKPEMAERMPDPAETFKKLDADGDGALTQKEMAAAQEKLRERMRERREGRGERKRRRDAGDQGAGEAENAGGDV